MCRWIPSSRVVAALLSLARKRLILRLGQGKSDSHDRRTLSPARPLGRLHGAGRGRPRGGLRAVCTRPCALEHARRYPRDGALAVAHCAARHSRRLARGKGTHRRRSLPRGILGGSPRRRRVRACARARGVRPCRDPRRLLWLVVGGPRAPCPQPAAAVPVPRRRLRRSGRQLQLRRGAIRPAAGDRHLPAGGGQTTDWSSIVKHTRLILAFGGPATKNGQVTSGGAGAHTMEPWLRRAKDAGIEFVSISPLRSDAPEFLGAQWVPIRPNTDTALMLAMAHTLLTEARYRAEFVARYCTGFEPFRRYLLGLDDGIAKDAQWAEAITGVGADTIRELARRAAASRSMITCAWSLQRAHHGEQPYWAAIVLAAMLGGIGLPGGGFGFGHGSTNGIGVPRVDVAGPEVPLPLNPARTMIPVARIADLLLNPGASYAF